MSDPAADPLEATRAAYAAAAPAYDQVVRPTFAGIARRLVALIDPAAGERGLDLATGTGLAAEEVLRRQPAVRLTGLDLSPAMIARLRVRVPAVAPVLGSAGALPFRSGAFDFVACQFGLHHFPDPGPALAEARRVTRPDGRLGLAFWHDEVGDRSPIETAYRDLLGRAAESGPAGPDPSRDAASVRRLARDAGWDAEVEVVRVPFRFADAAAYTRWRTAFPGDALWLSRLPAEARSDVRSRLDVGLAARYGGPLEVVETVGFLHGR